MSINIDLDVAGKSFQRTLGFTPIVVILLLLLSPLIFVIHWYQYKPLNQLPDELATLTVEDHGLNEQLLIYFDASAMGLDGRPGTDGNYLLVLDTATGVVSAERLPATGQQYEYQANGYTTHYAMTALNTVGQRYQFRYAGIPIATGGHYVVRDENGRTVDVVTDDAGMDLHDFIITPEGNYLYLAAHTTFMYRDSTLTCLPKCGNLGQSIVEITPEGIELYRYHLLDYYTREDFLMDDMLTWGNWNFYDLTHANSLRLSPDGSELIISVRHTNEVIALSREDGSLAWRSSDYTFRDDPYFGFSHQHDAQILPNGNLLLFDNGNERGENSRAVEYELDHEQQTMRLVWEYSNGQYQPNRGSARRTPAGNTLINFVSMEANDIVIVSPLGEILYAITIPEPYASYRASFEA